MSESSDSVDCSVVIDRCRPDVEGRGRSAYKVDFSAKKFIEQTVR